jgi:hypothetical protein
MGMVGDARNGRRVAVVLVPGTVISALTLLIPMLTAIRHAYAT